ncbi:MAG: hypothetical protein PHT95_06245 [Candidatus Omnitrophica bacterium]|nr:hypothetical protein [Candidatus Omnitrophota bacterium]
MLKKVKDAIQKAETEGIPSKDQKSKLPYDDAHMNAILLAIGEYFSKPASQALNAKLQFKPDHRDTGGQTKIIHRPIRQSQRHQRLGEYETVVVEVKTTNGHETVRGYVISGGDVESLREIRLVCSALGQALKDTPLDTQNARRYSPALKSLDTLLNSLPRFADKYLDIEGVWPQKYNIRLAEVETMRAELLAIQKDWSAEITAVKKAAKQDSPP